MSPLLALAAFDVLAGLLVGGLFVWLSTVEPAQSRHLRRWGVTWLTLGVAQILSANDLLGRPVPYIHVALPFLGILAILYLVAGTATYSGRRYSHWWTAATVAGAAATGVLDDSGAVDHFRSTGPVISVLVAATLVTAWRMFRMSSGRGPRRFTAAAMALWALNTASYPFIAPYEAAAPIGTFLSTLFQLSTGIGLLLSHFDDARRAAQGSASANQRLVEEVNHRVKNNLASIMGVLYSHQRFASAEERRKLQGVLGDLAGRVEAMSAVHQLLSARTWSPLPISSIAQEVIAGSVTAAGSGDKVRVTVQPSGILVSPKQANAIGLVVGELATNSVKHGLGARTSINLRLVISEFNGRVTMSFRDDGPGFDPAVLSGAAASGGVGMYLIRNLVGSDLGGELTLRNDQGAVTEVTFPRLEAFDP